MAFEDILNRIVSAEEDRGALQRFAEKYPALRDAMLMQEDYSRKMDAVKTDVEEVGKWREWKGKAWNEQANKTHAEVMAEQQVESLRAELALKGDENVDFDQIMTEISRRGVVTKTDLENDRKDLLDRNTYREDVTGRLGNMGALYENVFASGVERAMQHQRDFGEILPMKDVLTYMGTNKLSSLDEAYEKMFEPRLKELRTTQQAERDEKIRAEAIAKDRQERAAAKSPTDSTGGGSVRPRGFLEEKKIAAEKAAQGSPDLDKVPLGSGIISQIAAEEYRANQSKATGS